MRLSFCAENASSRVDSAVVIMYGPIWRSTGATSHWKARLTLNRSTTPNAHKRAEKPTTETKKAMLPSTVFPLEVHQRSLPIRRPMIDAYDELDTTSPSGAYQSVSYAKRYDAVVR